MHTNCAVDKMVLAPEPSLDSGLCYYLTLHIHPSGGSLNSMLVNRLFGVPWLGEMILVWSLGQSVQGLCPSIHLEAIHMK